MVAKQKFSNISILPLTPTKLFENQKKKKKRGVAGGGRNIMFKRSLNTCIQNKLYFSIYEVTVLHVIIL